VDLAEVVLDMRMGIKSDGMELLDKVIKVVIIVQTNRVLDKETEVIIVMVAVVEPERLVVMVVVQEEVQVGLEYQIVLLEQQLCMEEVAVGFRVWVLHIQ
jgi:hypothetical protein